MSYVRSIYVLCLRGNVRIGEYFGISPPTKKQVKPKNSSVADNSVFRPFSILWQFSYANENKAFIRTEREPANNDRSTTFE